MSGQDVGFDLPPNADDEIPYVAPVAYLESKSRNPEMEAESSDWTNHNNTLLYAGLDELDERSQDIIRSRWLAGWQDDLAGTGRPLRYFRRAHSAARSQCTAKDEGVNYCLIPQRANEKKRPPMRRPFSFGGREMQQEQARQWVVMKFGGTSVSSVRCWKTICGQAKKNVQDGKPVLIVVSALSGVTNLLTSLVADTVPERYGCLC